MKNIKRSTNIRTTWGGVLLNRKGIIPVFVVILMILTILISIGYSALNKNLSISGEAFLRSHGNVRIIGIKMNTTESDGNFTYNPEYSKRGTKVFSILPNIDSKINYTVQMNNTTGVKYKFDSVTVSNTNPNIECIPSVEVGTIIEVGVSSFTIEVKYKDGITMDEKTDICEIKYEFSAYDVTPPTIKIETITDGETSKTVKITVLDDEEGSGLSEENNYKYYLSTSNIELTGGEWKDYTNKEEFTIEGKNQTKYLWVYPVQDKAGNISDDKTGITESYLLQEYNFISTYTVSYIGNKFSTTAKVQNGVTATYDPNTSILTLNGNPTNDIVNLMLLNQTFNENDQFKITLDYISGTFTSSGEFTFSGDVVIATDIKNSSNENVSTRNWADIFLPTAAISNPSGILTTTSIGANEGSYLSVMLWMKSPSTTTFTNYKVKVNITKVDTKRVKYNEPYGILGDTPTREDYTFDGWYTEEIGGTKVTSDTIMATESDHNIYAHWKLTTYTVTYNGNKFSTTAKVQNGVTATYDPNTSILTLNGKPTSSSGVDFMYLSQSFNENDQFKITLDYISGTFTSSGGAVIATSVANSNKGNISTRNYSDTTLPTYGSRSSVLTITSVGANEGAYLYAWLWIASPSTATFTDYKVKVNITKVDTKRVKYNQAYGILGDTPTREGYTFDGWYTEEIGGTKVTSDTVVSAEGDHTLYAHWKTATYTLTINSNGGVLNGTTNNSVYNIASGSTTNILNPTRTGYIFAGWTLSGAGSSMSGTTFTMGYENATLTAKWTSSKPTYTYTGNSQLIDDGNGNWRIKFLTSGTLTFTNVGNGINGIDVFCVGGGGGGGGGYGPSYTGGGGGGGGYTKTSKGVTVNAGTAYSVTIGSGGTPSYVQQTAAGSGGTTSALGVSAAGGAGGYGGYYGGGVGGKGGSGGGSGGQMYNGIDAGVGGENGGNGTNASNGTSEGGKGQGSTTREFGENSGTLYSGGGGGAGATKNAAGGAGGGGNGAKEQTGSVNSTNGAANTGGGGGGNFYWNSGTGYGGSGIVVIRNHRGTEQTVLPTYTYTGNSQLIDDGNGNWRIKFLTSGTLTLTSLGIGTSKIDVFLVGGGAGGAGSGAGGGGGYTKTVKKVSVTLKSSNAIVIGAGGNADENGESSSAFGYSVSGGKTGNFDGGDGGSGGGSGFRKQELASAGSGGSDGSNGGNGYYNGGTGQGTTTREFGEASGTLYAGGGGGGGNNYGPASVCYPGGTGGAGGGGAGGRTEGSAGETNTGGGGGGTSGVLYAGGSGIVIIRNAR